MGGARGGGIGRHHHGVMQRIRMQRDRSGEQVWVWVLGGSGGGGRG